MALFRVLGCQALTANEQCVTSISCQVLVSLIGPVTPLSTVA